MIAGRISFEFILLSTWDPVIEGDRAGRGERWQAQPRKAATRGYAPRDEGTELTVRRRKITYQ